jgi:hypothetical protein
MTWTQSEDRRVRPRSPSCHVAFALAVLVAGCAAPLDTVAFGEPGALQAVITRYYARHASEEYGRCSRAYIDGITRARLVEQTDDRVVVDVHYFYRDRVRDGNELGGGECSGFGDRRFVVARTDTGIEVVEMSGPQRGRRPVSGG